MTPVRLVNLEPQFLRPMFLRGSWHHFHVDTIAEAQGIWFLCPKCFDKNGGRQGTHGVICWSRSRGVPDSAVPGPGRWKIEGTGYDDLTVNADPPSTARSVALKGNCWPGEGGAGWHGFVTNGEVTGE